MDEFCESFHIFSASLTGSFHIIPSNFHNLFKLCFLAFFFSKAHSYFATADIALPAFSQILYQPLNFVYVC